MKKGSISIKLIWMGAFLAVILLMSLVFFVGTLMVTNEVEANIRRANEDTVKFMQKTLDDNWRTVLEYNTQLLTDTQADNLSNTTNVEAFTQPKTYSFVMDFRSAVSANRMVEDVFMYFPAHDYVVGFRGTYPSHTYWRATNLTGAKEEYELWMSRMFQTKQLGYFTVQNGNTLELYYRISVFTPDGRILVAKIDTTELEKTLQWVCEETENSFLAMVDADGYVWASSGNYEKFVDSETGRLLEVNEKEYLYTERLSEMTALNYVAVKELDNAYHQSNAVKRIALIFLLFSFVSGVAVAVFLALRNARPVQQLASKLTGSEEVSGNELYFISGKVDDLMLNNKLALEALEKQQTRMICTSFLSECLKFDHQEIRPVEMVATICGISLENSNYALLVRERFGPDYSSDMFAVLDELENEDELICWTQKQDLDILMVGYDDETTLLHAEKVLRNNSSNTSKIVKSERFISPDSIRTQYLECLRQLQRKEVVLLPNIAEPGREFANLEGRSILTNFRNYIMDEDYSGARQIVSEVCRVNLKKTQRLERDCNRYAIIQQLLNTPYAETLYRELTQLAAQEDIQQFEKLLDEILTQCAQLKIRQMDVENDIAGRSRCLVDEMYADPVLSLCTISDEIGFSQSYVSRMFKKKYGIGVAQYINQVRVENAKKLIRSGASNIKAIALQVGFSSDVQFIRVFKKLEGVTPGTYRAEHSDHEV